LIKVKNVKPAAFDYFRPTSLSEALALLAKYRTIAKYWPEAKASCRR
jgi:hypothetical protein